MERVAVDTGETHLSAEAPATAGGDTLERAFEEAVRSRLDALDAAEAVALAGKDPEGVHQARVALRRLRGVATLFSPILGDELAAALRFAAKTQAARLAEARDLDVLRRGIEDLRPYLPRGAARPLLVLVEAARSSAYLEVRAAIADDEHAAWKDALLVVARARAYPGGETTTQLHDVVKAAIAERLEGVRKAARRVRRGRARDLHALRIAAKKLRYVVELGVDTVPDAGALLVPLKRLQGALGALQDAEATIGLLTRLLGDVDATDAEAARDAAELLVAWRMGEAEHAHRALEPRLAALAAAVWEYEAETTVED